MRQKTDQQWLLMLYRMYECRGAHGRARACPRVTKRARSCSIHTPASPASFAPRWFRAKPTQCCLRWSSAKHRAELYLSQRAFGFVISSRWPHRCATLIISRAAQPCCDWNVYPQSTSSDFIIFSALHVHCLKSVALIL